jgi:outer membrane protein TolC
MLILVLVSASCSMPPSGGGAPRSGMPSRGTRAEQARLSATLDSNGPIASQPVYHPFQTPGEMKGVEGAPGTPGEVVQVSPAEPSAPGAPSTVVERPDEARPTTALRVPPRRPEIPAETPSAPATTPGGEAVGELERAVAEGMTEVHSPPGTPVVEFPLTLERAVALALERNKRLAQQDEAIAEAEARLREKQNDYGPRLQFDYTIWTVRGVFVTPTAPDPDIPVEGTGRAEMTLYLPVWFARQSREAAVKQAMEDIKVRRQDYEVKRSQVAVLAVKYYFAVLEAEDDLGGTKEILDLNRRRLVTVKVLRERGEVLKNRVILGEKFVASAVEEMKFREADRALAESKLRKLLNLADTTKLVLTRPAALLPEAPDSAAARNRMRSGNPLLLRLYHERQSAYWTGRVRQYEEPSANFTIRYGATFPKYDEFTDDFLVFGLSVNWPVGKVRLDRAKRDQARHRVRQLELEQDIVDDELDIGLQETHAAYLKAIQRLEAKQLAVDLAEENLRLSKVFRERGTADSQVPEDVFQVVVNEIALVEAQMESSKATYEALGLLADLYQRMGAMDELVKELAKPAAEK